MYLPFWLTVPVLSGILRIFRRMFHRRGASTENGTPGEPPPVRAESAKVVRPATVAAPGAAAVLGTLGGAGAGTAGAAGTTGAKAKSQRASLLKYQRSIQSLVSTYVPAGSTIDATLDQLAEKWNPLYAAAQKQNLVEDVNSLVRDFLRPVRRSFLIQPPDLKRVHALAEQLSSSKSLAKIKKRDVLMRYIELYMIRCLQVKQT
jgi:hypothetical protein